MTDRMRKAAVALAALLAPASILATWLALRAELPDPLPTHWDLSGQVDDTMPAEVLLTVTLGTSAVLAALALALLPRRPVRQVDRAYVVGLVWAAWLAAAVFGAVALLATSATRAGEVGMQWWAILAIPGVPTLVALATALLVPVASSAPVPTPASSVRLGDTERVVWVGSSSSRLLLGVAGVLLLAAVFMVWTAWPVANVLALLGITLFWVHAVTVRVDEGGLSVGWGPARWPRTRVALGDVAAASAEEIAPLAWGGWGYRVTARGTAAVTRAGEGLVVDRRSGRRFAVTVDDPAPGADLLNALVERQERTTAR